MFDLKKVKGWVLVFPLFFFTRSEQLFISRRTGLQLEQLFTQEAGQQVAGSPDPEDPRTIVRYSNPDPDPDSGGLRPEAEQLPRLRPDSTPMTPIPPRLTGKSPNNSPTVCPPCLSNIAILWVLRYFALSPLVLYGY